MPLQLATTTGPPGAPLVGELDLSLAATVADALGRPRHWQLVSTGSDGEDARD